MLCARTGRQIEEGAEAVEAVEVYPTRAGEGLIGEDVVAVEAEAGGVAAEAEDDHHHHCGKRKTPCIYFFSHQKLYKKCLGYLL